MKYLTFLFLFASVSVFAQEVTNSEAYIQDTVIDGVKYFQKVIITEYDDGARNEKVGPRRDSAEFFSRAYRDAHDAVLPVAEGVRLLANRPTYMQTHRYYSDMLDSLTGKNYSELATERYISPAYGPAVWRVFYDSAGVTRNFFVYYNDSLNIGREITNAAQVIRGENPAFVPGTQDRRIRFFPYETFFARVTLLVRDEQGSLKGFFVPLPEVRKIKEIANDAGVNTGRSLWTDKDRAIRLVRIPITQTE